MQGTIGAFVTPQGTAWTLEDPPQVVKIPGKTRIPAGEYPVTLRTWGGFHERYAKRFGARHQGMLWLRDVPGFEDPIFLGCSGEKSAGWIAVGDYAHFVGEAHMPELRQSTDAYMRLYPMIVGEIKAARSVCILIRDVA